MPGKYNRPKWYRFITQLYIRIKDDEVTALGAQMTYFLVLSFFPFLIFLISILSYTSLSSEVFLDQLMQFVPQNTGSAVLNVIQETVASNSGIVFSFSMLTTLFAASKGIKAIMKALDKAYDQTGSRPWWHTQLIALAFTLVLAVMILLALFLLIFGQLLISLILDSLDASAAFNVLWRLLSILLALTVMILSLALMYKYLPQLTLKMKRVMPGALFAAVGWSAISLAFSVYVNNFGNYSKIYGSLGGIIALLIWIYLSSLIILIGGEINATVDYLAEGAVNPKYEDFELKLPWSRK